MSVDSGASSVQDLTQVTNMDPRAAYLGPDIWQEENALTEPEYTIMNIEDFLTEHNLSCVQAQDMHKNLSTSATDQDWQWNSGLINLDLESISQQTVRDRKQDSKAHQREENIKTDKSRSFLYSESKAARLARERAEKRYQERLATISDSMEFSPADLALATVPGTNFDPAKRSFLGSELKPQPIVKKRRKQFVDSERKDSKYWENRVRNNMAARRSREARRLKENQIALRAAFLEKENIELKRQIQQVMSEKKKIEEEKSILQQQLDQCQQ